jgi:hypothetical protein
MERRPRGRPRKAQSAPPTSPDAASAAVHINLPLLEVAEPWLLDTIMADPIAARMIVARISETIAAIIPGQADALLARMRKLGHTPRIEDQ